MFYISGFTDEISNSLDTQIATAKELGQRFICPRVLDGKNIADFTPEEFLANVKPKLDEAGISFSSIGSPIGKVKLDDEEGYQSQLAKLANLVEICKAVNCKYIRTFSFFVDAKGDYESYFPTVVSKIKGFLKVVEGTDIVLLHENEKAIYGDTPERALQLYKAVGSPQYKLCYDASNYIQCNVDPWKAYLDTRDFTVYYHMKDCTDGVEVPLGIGQGHIEDILADLVERGYDGFLTLEPHTWKYALLKIKFYLLPLFSLAIKNSIRVYRYIDRTMGKKMFQRVTRKEVYLWQYNNLIQLLNKVGGING